MSNRVVHFEIHAVDPERAMKFYKDIFGWEFIKWDGSDQPYWMVMTAPKDSKEAGINGGLLKQGGKVPEAGMGPNAFVCTMVVEDFDKTAAMIESAGGVCQMPKFAIANMAWQGYYKDLEGNIFGIHQADENAK
ncbi:MAG: VOC family protein [Patescibacteria group bacterium]